MYLFTHRRLCPIIFGFLSVILLTTQVYSSDLPNKEQPSGPGRSPLWLDGGAGINMRELFKPAILSNSASILIGHNHPGGTMKASHEDLMITEKINKVGNLLGISLLDHIIVSNDKALSLREENPDLFK